MGLTVHNEKVTSFADHAESCRIRAIAVHALAEIFSANRIVTGVRSRFAIIDKGIFTTTGRTFEMEQHARDFINTVRMLYQQNRGTGLSFFTDISTTASVFKPNAIFYSEHSVHIIDMIYGKHLKNRKHALKIAGRYCTEVGGANTPNVVVTCMYPLIRENGIMYVQDFHHDWNLLSSMYEHIINDRDDLRF